MAIIKRTKHLVLLAPIKIFVLSHLKLEKCSSSHEKVIMDITVPIQVINWTHLIATARTKVNVFLKNVETQYQNYCPICNKKDIMMKQLVECGFLVPW